MEILLHGHHFGLVSVVTSKEFRVEEIKREKLPSQHKLRLRLLQSVPLDHLPVEVVETAIAWDEAEEAWKKARDKTDKAENEARKAFSRAVENFYIACQDHRTELEALHRTLCVPDCPWDGERILAD